MAAVSIRHMNITLVAMEHMNDHLVKSLFPKEKDVIFYWWVEYKTHNPKRKWKKVNEFVTTKAEIARLFCKYYKDGNHRLRCIMRY